MTVRRFAATAPAALRLFVAVLLTAFGSAWSADAAHADVTHQYLFQFSQVPAEGPLHEPVAQPGPLSGVGPMAVDSGHVWVDDKIEGSPTRNNRIDEFDASTGAFLAQPLQSENNSLQYDAVGIGRLAGESEPQLYVTDTNSGVASVGVYSTTGVKKATWTGSGTPSHGFDFLPSVAADRSSSLADWAAGDVYVASREQGVVDVFKPEAGASEFAEKYVTQLTGTCATPASCTEDRFTNPSSVVVDSANGDVIIVDKNDAVDVFEPTVLGEYAFVRQLTGTPAGPFTQVRDVAVDSGTGDIYVTDVERHEAVDQFTGEGVYRGQLTEAAGVPFGKFLQSVAVDDVSHDVYVGVRQKGVDVFGPTLVLPDVQTAPPTEVAASSATLNGTVNPANAGQIVSCVFLWGTTKAFGHEKPCSEQSIPDGSQAVPVHAELTAADGLRSGTTYFYRLQASNANGTAAGQESEDQELRTAGPGLRGESVSEVTATSATLEASIDPHGQPTSYYFQYGPTSSYGLEAPAAPGISLGEGEGVIDVSRDVQTGLSAGVKYHYRVVAVSEGNEYPEADREFTTQPTGSVFALPDSRQWEMVSPSNKKAALILPLGENLFQAANSGNAFTFQATASIESGASGFATLAQVFSIRNGAGGWTSRDITNPHEEATGATPGEYPAFSDDLSSAVVQPLGRFTPLSPSASESSAYLRSDFSAGAPTTPCAEECYRPLVTGCPATGECAPEVQQHADVPAGTEFGETDTCPVDTVTNAYRTTCGPEFIGTSPNLKHIVIRSGVALRPGGERQSLYEWSDGSLALVSVSPDGQSAHFPSLDFPSLGNSSGKSMRHAVSDDGSRVVWSGGGGGHLYMRVNAMQPQSPLNGGACTVPTDACTVQLDTVTSGNGSGKPSAEFQLASSDGSRVFFTDDQELTVDAGSRGNLYECVMVLEAGGPKCQLSNLTPKQANGEPPLVWNQVIGASEDGSWLYFVADGVLAPGASTGKCGETAGSAPEGSLCNLYVWHDGVTRYIASLSNKDFMDWNGSRNVFDLLSVAARVSPNGRWLAFTSERELKQGYDPRDALTGEPDEEVYLYDASSGKLACASCNPTGARPRGVRYGEMSEGLGNYSADWPVDQGSAGALPDWTAYDGSGKTVYQARFLADNGRVFFDSSDGLVPEDVNGLTDVYEFEPVGVGGCASRVSLGSFEFVAGESGCVGLISSGKGAGESFFIDASATGGRDDEGNEGGGDVFFLTVAKLAAQDLDQSADVYDAHECRDAAPCPAASGEPSPPCATGDACKPAPAPQPSVFGAPASATLSGASNVMPAMAVVVKRKSLTRAQRLSRALAVCGHKARRRGRVRCERGARRRFGATASGRVNTRKKGRG
ncbi:MAG: hypothetical protein ACRDK4_00415 [Solirubrobacteraceae bacterium]